MVQAAIARAATMRDLEQLLLTVVTENESARNLSLQFKIYGVEPNAQRSLPG
jgi:hypothetical protein